MKRLFRLTLAAFILGTGVSAWAAGQPTPTAKFPIVRPTPDPNSMVIHERTKNQWALLKVGLKSGKITQEQAIGIREGLKNARLQTMKFYKANHKSALTQDQLNRVQQTLNANSAVLGETSVSAN